MEKLRREEVAQRAQAFVENVLASCQLDLEAHGGVEDSVIRIELDGIDTERVLSDGARLLYAINHLVNQIFYRQSREGCSFIVDCENYRIDRASELELMAQKAAEKVRTSGAQVSLQPMPASERRIIHLTLADERDVRTESEGSGRRRRVLIVPA